ncbi:MAG: hypothetical protein Q4C50_01370 [Eubacteriales bacterium]|nr:hypothetical protein [Eubacteriales bacterium]
MAALHEMGTYRSRNGQRHSQRNTTTYIDGNVVRHIQTAPNRSPQQKNRTRASVNTRRNRERALNMTMPYVVFLTAATIATVFLCVNYLKLQAAGTTYRKEIATLESQLSTARLANDNAYEDAVSSVNMENVKEIAVKQLGMVYADEGQVITYNSQDGDYIRQYGEIPTE